MSLRELKAYLKYQSRALLNAKKDLKGRRLKMGNFLGKLFSSTKNDDHHRKHVLN